jgi:hypothetical protein
MNGIVDIPYNISGPGSKDYFPRTNTEIIPEFSSGMALICVIVAMMAVVVGSRRAYPRK